MRLIAGLGNPGKEYQGTRHNVGVLTVDEIAKRLGVPGFTKEDKFKSLIAKQGDLLLFNPQTFMNKSGLAVAGLVNFYKAELRQLYVVHDDLDIRLGDYKLQLGRGPKVHRGLESIYQSLGSKDFWHVRVGIDNRQSDAEVRMQGEAYVLSKFLKDEKEKISRVVEEAAQKVLAKINEV